MFLIIFEQIIKRCQLLPFLSTISINVNTFTMIAASFERLVSIVFPFKSKLSKHKCILIIILIWILAMCASLPWVFILHVEHINIFVMKRIDLTSHKNDLAENHFDFSGDLSENFMFIKKTYVFILIIIS